jgi:hypothetical protein
MAKFTVPLLAPLLFFFAILCAPARADELAPALKSAIDGKLPAIRAWAADPAIRDAVREQNHNPSPAVREMTQETWRMLSVLDPQIRAFTRNQVGRLLKSKKDALIAEAFVSAANGTKVGFLSKPTNWSHAGKPKHETPMRAEVWYGTIEVDESTGLRQVQVGIPVLDDGKPIGSLVVGLDVAQLQAAP